MIKSRIKAARDKSNLEDYEKTYRAFDWKEFSKGLNRDSEGKVNICRDAIDRWADSPKHAERTALILNSHHQTVSFSFSQLKEHSCRWANMLWDLGYEPGDRLFVLLTPSPELYFVMLACARLGVTFCILHTKSGFDQLETTIANGRPKGIVTSPDLAERFSVGGLESVSHILLTETPLPGLFESELLTKDILADLPGSFNTPGFAPAHPLYMVYTSGSTAPPKGVVHAHGDMAGLAASARFALDLTEDDILWTDGDPGWIAGTVYSTFAPWLIGAASVVQTAKLSASTWYHTLEKHKVTVWYTSPMVMRRLVSKGDDLPRRYDLSNLKHIASVGEPLTPELFFWVRNNLGPMPHDTWWMSETGMICLANFPSMDIKLCSIGKPLPGIEAQVLDQNGEVMPILTMGELALKANWPAMMISLWRDPDRYQEYFRFDGWFLTGDMAIKDEDGYFFLQGRNDDLIKAGDKFIGPYEVEQILSRHPAVREVGVIAKSGGESGLILKAFIAVREDYNASNRLNQEIRAFVKGNLEADIPFTEIEFLKELPKTRTGKLVRRALRALELGLPSGDTSGLRE